MSKIQWEYDLVEKPFCEQLRGMGWQWIEGDVDVPELTERESFREVVLKGRLEAALRRLNLRDGRPWLDEARVAHAIRDLEKAAGHRLMEVNQSATSLLLKGTVAEGLPDWDHGRPQPVRYIDFENPANNDFLVVNQFKVELTSGRGHIIPDAVLFVNGIPLVVAEFKSPGIENPLQEAINQLLRYSNQRREVWPALYADNEGVERLFHTNQLLIASDFFESRAATVGAPPEAYLEWADTSPVPLGAVAEEIGVLPRSEEEPAAAAALRALGAEHGDRPGTPLFFRTAKQLPETLQKKGGLLRSQQILAAGMLRPAHLLDLMRNFSVFQQADGKTRKVVARYQQFRAVHEAVKRLRENPTRLKSATGRDERGGIIWHTQGSGKSLSMVFLVRKMRMTPHLNRFKIVVVTDRTDLQNQLEQTAQLSGEAVRPTDTDLKTRESPTALTQRLLGERTPDIVMAMLQKYQPTGDSANKPVRQNPFVVPPSKAATRIVSHSVGARTERSDTWRAATAKWRCCSPTAACRGDPRSHHVVRCDNVGVGESLDAFGRSDHQPRRNPQTGVVRPQRGESACVVTGRPAGKLDLYRIERAVALQKKVYLAAALRPPMVERRFARHGGLQFSNLGNDGRLEQRSGHRMPTQSARGRDPRQMAGQTGVGKVALGFRGDPLDRISLIGRKLIPLEGCRKNRQPALRCLRRDPDLPPKLAEVDFLPRERRGKLHKTTELLPVRRVEHHADVPLNIGSQVTGEEIGRH